MLIKQKTNQLKPPHIFNTPQSGPASPEAPSTPQSGPTSPEAPSTPTEEPQAPAEGQNPPEVQEPEAAQLARDVEQITEDDSPQDIRDGIRQITDRGQEEIEKGLKRVENLKKAGIVIGAAAALIAGWAIFRRLRRSGREAEDGTDRQRGSTTRRILTFLGGAAVIGLGYRAIKGTSLEDWSEAWEEDGITGIANLAAGRRKSRDSLRREIDEDRENVPTDEMFVEIDGERVPAIFLSKRIGEVPGQINEHIMKPLVALAKDYAGTSFVLGAIAVRLGIVQSAGSFTLRSAKNTAFFAARLPIRMAGRPVRSIFAVTGLMLALNETRGIKVPKDPAMMGPFLKNIIASGSEHLPGNLEISEQDIDEAMEYITDTEKMKQVIKESGEYIEANFANFFGTMGGLIGDGLDAFGLTEKERVQAANSRGIGHMTRILNSKNDPDDPDSNYSKVIPVLEELRRLIETDAESDKIDNKLAELKSIAENIPSLSIEEGKPFLTWSLSYIDEDGIPSLLEGPKNLMVNPTLTEEEQYKHARNFYTESSFAQGTETLFRNMGSTLREMAQTVVDSVREGKGAVMKMGAKAVFWDGLGQTYILGPFRFWGSVLQNSFTGEGNWTEVVAEYGNTVVPVMAFSMGRGAITGIFRSQRGVIRGLAQGATYPVSGTIDAFRFLSRIGGRGAEGLFYRARGQRGADAFGRLRFNLRHNGFSSVCWAAAQRLSRTRGEGALRAQRTARLNINRALNELYRSQSLIPALRARRQESAINIFNQALVNSGQTQYGINTSNSHTFDTLRTHMEGTLKNIQKKSPATRRARTGETPTRTPRETRQQGEGMSQRMQAEITQRSPGQNLQRAEVLNRELNNLNKSFERQMEGLQRRRNQAGVDGQIRRAQTDFSQRYNRLQWEKLKIVRHLQTTAPSRLQRSGIRMDRDWLTAVNLKRQHRGRPRIDTSDLPIRGEAPTRGQGSRAGRGGRFRRIRGRAAGIAIMGALMGSTYFITRERAVDLESITEEVAKAEEEARRQGEQEEKAGSQGEQE